MSTVTIKPKPKFSLVEILEGFEGVAIIIACYITFFLKSARSHWGLTKSEANRYLLGDELVLEPKAQFSHGVDINAPSSSVWPWVAQIGQGRGGFYTYTALENIAGLNIQNADSIIPEFQNPKVGTLIPFSPTDAYPIAILEKNKAIVLSFSYDMDKSAIIDPDQSLPENYFQLSWLWYIEDLGPNRSRFISRNRLSYSDSIKNKILFGWLMEPVVFAMDRKMCLGIKKRAERFRSSLV